MGRCDVPPWQTDVDDWRLAMREAVYETGVGF